MDINDLTLKQIKEIQTIFTEEKKEYSFFEDFIGKYVLCRTVNEGVNAGEVVTASKYGVILKDARRLYYHKPNDPSLSWYEGVAISGLSSDSRVGAPAKKIIVEKYSLTICTGMAEQSIRGFKSYEQS